MNTNQLTVKNTDNNNQNNSNIKWWIIAIATILTLINISVYQCSKADVETVTTTDTVSLSDTVEVRDTLCFYQPIQKLEYVERFDTLFLPQPKDTVPIPMKRVEYSDSVIKNNGARVLYYASVSGFEPSLDTLTFDVSYPQITNTEYVTTTIEKIKPAPRFSFGPSLGIGYGLTSKQFDAYAGFSFTYRF